MNDFYSPESNLARQRKLDSLFADQPYLSATMRASRLHERVEAPQTACVLQPIADEADELLRRMVEGRAGRAYESAEDEWWFAPKAAPAREIKPKPTVVPPQHAPEAAQHGRLTGLALDLLVEIGPDGTRIADVRSAASAPDVMTLDEAASYLRVSPSTLRSWTRTLSVPNARLGRKMRFRRSALLEWLGAQER